MSRLLHPPAHRHQRPEKIAGETALTITLEYVPKLAQCAPEDFDAVWDEFVGKLADLPLAEYEQLVTRWRRRARPTTRTNGLNF